MKKINTKLKAGVFAVTMLFLFMATAPTTIAIKTPQYSISLFDLGETKILGLPADPSGGDEPYPPSAPRCSFMFLTGIYGEYEGKQKLIGLRFTIWDNPRNGAHTANWEPANVYMTMEGDHEGEYYYPQWYWRNSFSGGAYWSGFSIEMTWDPAHDRISYFHLWADYKEDGQHIRYVDRTLTESWGVNEN